MIASCIRENCRHTPPVAPPVWGSLPSRADPLFTGTSASCTRGIGRATVLGIPEGVLRARPLPLRVEPTVSGTADGLHARDMPSVLDRHEGRNGPDGNCARTNARWLQLCAGLAG